MKVDAWGPWAATWVGLAATACAWGAVAPKPQLVFFDDFSAYRDPKPLTRRPNAVTAQVRTPSTSGPVPVTGWEVIRHSAHKHLHQRIAEQTYWITHQYNEHCPITPRLKNFTLEFDAKARGHARAAIMYVGFHLDDRAKTGYRIYYRWGAKDFFQKVFTSDKQKPLLKYIPKTTRLALLDYEHRLNLEPILNKKFPEFGSPSGTDPVLCEADAAKLAECEDVLGWQKFRIEVAGERVRFFHNGRLQATLVDPGRKHPGAGRIGFDTLGPWPMFSGAITLDNVRITTTDPISTKTVLHRTVEFPYRLNAIHGQKVRYTVRIRQRGDVYEVFARMQGGPAWDYGPRAPLKHAMVNPYVRIEDADSLRVWPIVLFAGKVGGTYPEKAGPFGMNDHMGPVQRTTYLRRLPKRYRLYLGYDHYLIIGRDHQSGGPSEILVDPTTGKIVYFGGTMRSGMSLRVESPPEKQVVRRVKPTNKFYDGFKTFIAENHYFAPGEPIRFRADLWATGHADATGLSVRFDVLDVFSEALGESHSAKLTPVQSGAADALKGLGCTLVSTGFLLFKARAPGVYHLRTTLRRDGRALKVLTKAFEVVPPVGSAKTAPELSGLPDFGFKLYVTEDAYQVDAYHYVSTFMRPPDPNWLEVVRALGRRLFLARIDLTDDAAVKKNADLIRTAAGVAFPKYKRLNQCYFWVPNVYGRPVVQQLVRDYLAGPATPKPPGSRLAKLLGKTDSAGVHALYMDIRTHHFRPWIDYLNRRFAANTRALRARALRINPKLQFLSYGHPMPCGNDYIGIEFCRFGGLDFMADNVYYDDCLFEGYFPDHRHSMDRTWATMALMKMVCPRVKIREDNEGECVCVEDGQNARAWAPYGLIELAPGFQRKALLLQALATTYFDGTRFRWAWDNVYRPGSFTPLRWRELVEASRIIRQVPVARPVRTVAYAWSWDAINSHPIVWDDLNHPYNTADETLVFAGEEVPRAGMVGGYVCRLSDIDKLPACDTLVLPPLGGVKLALVKAIRRKHRQGVHLVGFENVAGLEDLFGIAPAKDAPAIDSIAPADNALARRLTDDLVEQRAAYHGHFGQARYRVTDATPILSACDKSGRVVGPALVVKKGKPAGTAFWAVPPTDVWRERIGGSNCAGEVMSELVKRCTGRVVREIATPPVTTSVGQVLAIWGTDDKLYVVSYENAYPDPSVPIRPVVTIRMPGIGKAEVRCDRAHELVRGSGELRLITTLEPEQFALYVITPKPK